MVSRLICFGWSESRYLKKFLDKATVSFLPFGVDLDYFQPRDTIAQKENQYILVIGADPKRDFDLILKIAPQIKKKILLVTSKVRLEELRRKYQVFPNNLAIYCDLPFRKMKKLLGESLFVVLPVKNNSYSGATTTLLQALAMAKVVIVSKTAAIRKGYYLRSGYNCIFVKPGSKKAMVKAINHLLAQPKQCAFLANNAYKTAIKYLSWDQFIYRLFRLFQNL